MNLDGKRLLICEEALNNYSGHYYTWIKSIRKINQEAGVTVEVGAHKELEPSIQEEFSAHLAYSVNNWSGIYNFPQAWKRYLGVFKHNRLVYRETKSLFEKTETVDCILLPAARLHHLIAWRFLCARFLKKHFKRVVIFMLTSEAVYNEDYTDYQFKRSTKFIQLVLKSFRKFTSRGEVLFAGDSHVTCSEYTRLSGIPFTLFPSPGVALAKTSSGPKTIREDQGPVFVILGLSVYDKGIDLWQTAVLEYLDKHPEGKSRFIIQWGVPTISYDGEAIEIDERLRTSDKVTLLERALTDEEYAEYFQKADFLSLPYRRRMYFNQISGVLIEAACSGIPMIVTENTWLSWAMREYGAGVTVRNDDASDLYDKLLYCEENWETLAGEADKMRSIALEKNSTERYLKLLWEEGSNEAES